MNSESKNKWIAICSAVVVIAFFFGGIIFYSFNSNAGSVAEDQVASSSKINLTQTPSMNSITTADGLTIQDEVIGTGAEAKAGQQISVNYKGTLSDGTKFDSSYDRGQPFEFTLGAGQVIQGWDKGFEGMKIGGKRKLTIPPALGYGNQAVGGVIPANSTLIFEVELLGVK